MRAKGEIYRAVALMVSLAYTLSELKAGKSEHAAEHLEFLLDSELSILGTEVAALDSKARSLIVNALAGVKDYRRRYPRVVRAALVTSDAALHSSVSDTAEEGKHLLDELFPGT